MYHYFGFEPYSNNGGTVAAWRRHRNPIVVLRNPVERVVSAILRTALIYDKSQRQAFFAEHSSPYMNNILTGCKFRIIDFHDLEQYIPRSDKIQSPRTDSRVEDATTVEDVYVTNEFYTLHELQHEMTIYKKLMASCERVSVDEWKKMTRS